LRKNGEFLLEPFSIFEEIGSIVLVKIVPPFGGIGIESALRNLLVFDRNHRSNSFRN